MDKLFSAMVILGIFFCVQLPAAAEEDPCPELLKNEANLDKVYDLSRLVFIAHISSRGGVNPHIYNYELLAPELKGTVPEQGYVTFVDDCRPINDDAIYLFFLDSMDEKIADANAVFFSLSVDGLGYTWIAEWIEAKLAENAVIGDWQISH